MALFEFNADQGETPQTLEAKRAIVMALARAGTTGVAHNLGEGIGKVGNALAYAMANSRYENAEAAAQKSYADSLNSILGGGTPASAPATSPVPQQPQIPAAAVSPDSLSGTPAPLSGGMLPVADNSAPRGIRNNNPLNIEAGNFTQSQPGFTGSDGRFAQFASLDQGLSAADNLLQSYAGKGLNTVNSIVSRWAPPSDNNPTSAYAATVAKSMGVDPNAPLDMSNPAIRGSMIKAMAQFENGQPLPQVASNDQNFVPATSASNGMNPQLAAMLSPNMTVGQQAFAPLAFNGQPQSANPLANPQSFAPQTSQQGQPNITTVPTRPVTLPVEGQSNGRAAVVQALQNQPQQTAIPASNIPPQVADTIRKLSMNPLPQAQQMAAQLMQQYMKPHQYGFQTLPDGTIIRTDPLSGTATPIYQTSRPQFNAQAGRDQFGNPIPGFVDPTNRSVQLIGPNGQVMQPGQAGQTTPQDRPSGQAFLDTLDKPVADQVKAIAEGRMAFPAGFALKSPYWQHMIQMVSQYDPSFDAVNYNARAKTRADFTSGKSAQSINALNTVIGHLQTLSDAVNNLNNGSYPAINSVENFVLNATGDPRIKQFDTTKKAVVDELTRVWRGSGGSEGDIKTWSDQINAANSPQQLHAVIAQLGELLQSKIGSLANTYNQGMGTTATPLQFITPQAAKTLKTLEERASGNQPVQSNTLPQGWSVQVH